METAHLFTYKHKFNKYSTFQCVAPDLNTANALLTIWAADLPEYDGRNCDFECKESVIMMVVDTFIADKVVEWAMEIRGF